jgi:hypothetical protein
MQMDLVLACLLICVGAMLAYIADERFGITPKLEAWIGRVLGEF